MRDDEMKIWRNIKRRLTRRTGEVALTEKHNSDIYHFRMHVYDAERIQSWVHEFTEMGSFFALIKIIPDLYLCDKLAHILACFTCGAYNSSLHKYMSANDTWRRRKRLF